MLMAAAAMIGFNVIPKKGYKTPAAIIKLPVEFEMKSIDLP